MITSIYCDDMIVERCGSVEVFDIVGSMRVSAEGSSYSKSALGIDLFLSYGDLTILNVSSEDVHSIVDHIDEEVVFFHDK